MPERAADVWEAVRRGTASTAAFGVCRVCVVPTHMVMRLGLSVAVLVLAAISPAMAQQGPADEAAIRQRLMTYADARTRRDAAAEALCYTADGDFRSSAGPFVSGRAAIEKQLTVNDPTYQFVLTVTHLRFVSPTVAVADADLVTGAQGRTAKLIGSYVMVREGAEWLISAARIAVAPVPRTPQP